MQLCRQLYRLDYEGFGCRRLGSCGRPSRLQTEMFECLKMIVVEETGRKSRRKKESLGVMRESKERHGQQCEDIMILLVECLIMPGHPMTVINEGCWSAIVPLKRWVFGTLSCYQYSIAMCRPFISHNCCSYMTPQASRCWPDQSRWVSEKLPDQERNNIDGDLGRQMQDNCTPLVPFRTPFVYHDTVVVE